MGLAADLGNQDREFTEDVGLENRSSQVDHHHEDELLQLFRTHFIATDDQHRVVQADKVEEHLLVSLLVALPVVVNAVIVIVRRDPWLPSVVSQRIFVGDLNEEEPHAGHQVQVDDE